MLWCSVYLYLHIMPELRFCALPISKYFWQWLKAFNLFRLATWERNIDNVVKNVENSVQEKCKTKHKFGEAKVCKAEQVRKDFVNPKIENEVFG